jgi:hypothetical protein
MRRLAPALCCLLLSSAALADDPPPVQMGALVRGFALPAELGRPQVAPSGGWLQRVDLEDTNEFSSRSNSNSDESIFLEGEDTQLSYNVRYGFADRWEAGLYIPLLAQGGGILGPVIQQWHKFWGLPNEGRENYRNGLYQYTYMHNGQTLLNVRQGSVTFGDIQLGAGYQLLDHLAARVMLSLPSGDGSHLSGNGAFGAAEWLDGGLPLGGFLHWLTLYGSLGYSETGAGDVIASQQKHDLAFGAAGFGIQFNARWDAKFQLYLHAAPYRDSELAALDHIGAPLTVSTSYRIGPKTTISLGFQEKANIFASPDFGVHLGLAFY